MTEATHFSNLLLPELEAEFKRTRRILSAVPDGHGDFKPHEKSMSLAKLAGHVAELPGFIQIILTHPDLDMALPGNPRKPVVLETTAQVVAEFDQRAGAAIATLKETSNQTFEQPWSLSRGELKIFSGPRYEAYRALGVNHIIHHRAQLGCYIRELNQPLPGTYGPSADGM
jgi:uncharacterized damage-inducible protein DinB